MELKERLGILGIDADKPTTEIVENLLCIVEYLYKEIEVTEQERFHNEISRVLRPTN